MHESDDTENSKEDKSLDSVEGATKPHVVDDMITTSYENSNVESANDNFVLEDFLKNNIEDGDTLKPSVDQEVMGAEASVNESAKEQRSGVDVTVQDDETINEENLEASGEYTRLTSVNSDGFVDIDISTINGAITAIVSEHIPSTSDYNDVHAGNEIIVEEESNDVNSANDDVLIDEEKTIINDDGSDGEHDGVIHSDNVINKIHVNDIPEDDGDQVSELQKSLNETSIKNVLNSMELARENLVMMSNDDVSFDDSFASARSELTITDTDDTTSFLSARDRLTPVNDISVSLPDLSSPNNSNNDITPKASPADPKRLSASKFEIQFIDEKTNKVLSRESLNTALESSLKVEKAGKETTV